MARIGNTGATDDEAFSMGLLVLEMGVIDVVLGAEGAVKGVTGAD